MVSAGAGLLLCRQPVWTVGAAPAFKEAVRRPSKLLHIECRRHIESHRVPTGQEVCGVGNRANLTNHENRISDPG